MKTFVYGRPAVDGGDRGYRIFQSQGLSNEELRQLKELFSDADPDVRRLQQDHFLPFFAYFPWSEGTWVFGKGRIEARGRLGAMYYSYLFHGVVLDKTRRELLGHNPFVLADFFDLSEERRAAPPLIPDKINDKGLMFNLHNKARALAAQESLVHEAGKLAETYLFEGPGRVLFPHSGRHDGNFWGVFYFLLPPSLRASASMTTWSPFLLCETELSAATEPAQPVPSGSRFVEVYDKGRSLFSDLVLRFARDASDEQARSQQVRRYEALADDLQGRRDSAAEKRRFFESLFRALERPSLQSIALFPPVGVRGFVYKQQHLEAVWAQNGSELQLFPDLPDKLVAALAEDFSVLPESERQQYEAFWERFMRELGARLQGEGLRLALVDSMLCPLLVARLPADRIISMLIEEVGAGGTLPLALLKLHHPQWANFFDRLIKLLWGKYLRACRDGNSATLHRIDAALKASHQLQPDAFAQSSQLLIDSRWMEHALPYLRKDAFWTDLLEVWGKLLEARRGKRENESMRLARIRLASCLKAVYGSASRWPASFQRLQAQISGNWLISPFYDTAPEGSKRS